MGDPWISRGSQKSLPTNLAGLPKIPPIQLCDLIGRIDGVKEDLIDFGPENKKTRFPKGGISQHGETSETCGIFSYTENIYMYI